MLRVCLQQKKKERNIYNERNILATRKSVRCIRQDPSPVPTTPPLGVQFTHHLIKLLLQYCIALPQLISIPCKLWWSLALRILPISQSIQLTRHPRPPRLLRRLPPRGLSSKEFKCSLSFESWSCVLEPFKHNFLKWRHDMVHVSKMSASIDMALL